MKFIKYLSIVVIFFLVLAAGLLATLNFVDLDRYKGTLENQISKITGRDFSIEGDSELSISLQPRVLLRDVRLQNAPWGSQPEMLRIGQVELQMALLPLLKNRIEVTRLIVSELDVVVANSEDGQSNWSLGDGKTATEKAPVSDARGPQTEFMLNEVHIENARISYQGDANNPATRLDIDQLDVRRIDDDFEQWDITTRFNEIPVAVQGKTSYLHALFGGRPFKNDLKGTLGNLAFTLSGEVTLRDEADKTGLNMQFSVAAPNLETASNLAATELPDIGPIKVSGKASDSGGFYIFSLDGSAAELKLTADGRVARALDGKGDEITVTLQAPDLQQIGRLGGTELPPVGPVDLTGKISAIEDGHKLSAIDLKIAKSDLKGEISIAHQREPMFIKAGISSSLLDLTPFQKQDSDETPAPETKTQPATKKEAGERVFPDTPLPFEQLRTVNADIDFQAATLESDVQILRDVKLALKLDSGKLTLNPVQAQLEGGPIAGEVVLDASKQKTKPVITLLVHSKGLELGKFKQLKETMSGGSTKVNVQLNGGGESVREIMAGLNGEVVLDIGEAVLADGTINLIGGDILDSLLGALAPTEDKAPNSSLECAVVKFDVQDGDARANKGIALKSDRTVIVGSGEIDLKTERIGFKIQSHSRAAIGLDAGDLTRVVGLGGTLANPRPVVDVEGTAKTGATIGAAVLTLGTSYLAQKLVESAIKDDHPCLTALGKKPPKAETASEKEAKDEATAEKE